MSKQPANVTSITKEKKESIFCGLGNSTIGKAVFSMGRTVGACEEIMSRKLLAWTVTLLQFQTNWIF